MVKEVLLHPGRDGAVKRGAVQGIRRNGPGLRVNGCTFRF